MASFRLLKLEIAGCVLLLAATLFLLVSSPDAPWRDREGSRSTDDSSAVDATDSGSSRRRAEPRAIAPEKPRPPSLEVNGRLIVVGADGSEQTTRSGELFLKLEFDADPAEVHRVEVIDGSFAANAYLGAWVSCDTATVDGDYAVVDLPRTRLAAGEELVVRARIRARMRVFVEDATSGSPVAHVVLRAARGSERLFPSAIDDLVVIGAPGPSPREVAADLPPLDLWVDAPGYAFERIHVDPSRGGDVIVKVERPTTLRVQLVGVVPPDGLVLSLRDENDQELQRVEAGGAATFTWERIRPRRMKLVAFVPEEFPTSRSETVVEPVGDGVIDAVLDLPP